MPPVHLLVQQSEFLVQPVLPVASAHWPTLLVPAAQQTTLEPVQIEQVPPAVPQC